MTGVEVALLGSAAASATATTAATAATAGLFGVGGSLTLGGALSAGSILFSAVSGLQGMQASKAEANQIKFQEQAERTQAAQEEANRQARLTTIMNDSLAMQAGRGGRLGSASDLAIAGFSDEEAKRESKIAAYDSQYRTANLRMQRSQVKKQGTASLISGFTDAASKAGVRYEMMQERTRTI